MLAFRMKKPLSKVDLEARLSAAYDTAKWGPVGKELIQRASGMRERAREASQGYDAKGADECRQVFGLYQALIFQLDPQFSWTTSHKHGSVSASQRMCLLHALPP